MIDSISNQKTSQILELTHQCKELESQIDDLQSECDGLIEALNYAMRKLSAIETMKDTIHYEHWTHAQRNGVDKIVHSLIADTLNRIRLVLGETPPPTNEIPF